MNSNPDQQQAEIQDEFLAQSNAESLGLSLEDQITALSAELENAQQEAANQRDIAIRSVAESENVRRRAEREVSNASKFALERFAKEILGVVDSLEKALEMPAEEASLKAMREGIELTHKLMLDTLSKFSIEQISPLGLSFNPELHEAMVMQESPEHEPGTVIFVVQTGYSLSGRLIRPARVVVSKGPAPSINTQA